MPRSWTQSPQPDPRERPPGPHVLCKEAKAKGKATPLSLGRGCSVESGTLPFGRRGGPGVKEARPCAQLPHHPSQQHIETMHRWTQGLGVCA